MRRRRSAWVATPGAQCGTACALALNCVVCRFRAFSQLLRDLVYTTDSHRALKARAAKQAHELESWRDKARAGAVHSSAKQRTFARKP